MWISLTLSILSFQVQTGIEGGLIQPPLRKIVNIDAKILLLGTNID